MPKGPQVKPSRKPIILKKRTEPKVVGVTLAQKDFHKATLDLRKKHGNALVRELKILGVNKDKLIKLGLDWRLLLEMGFNHKEIRALGYTLDDYFSYMQKIFGPKFKTMLDIQDLLDIGFKIEELRKHPELAK